MASSNTRVMASELKLLGHFVDHQVNEILGNAKSQHEIFKD